MAGDEQIQLRELLGNPGPIDVVSVESGGRPIAKRMIELMGSGTGNLVKMRPTPLKTRGYKGHQVIENVDGAIIPQRTYLVCDEHICTGGTLNVVLDYLVGQGCKPKDIYVCVETNGHMFLDTRRHDEVRMVPYEKP